VAFIIPLVAVFILFMAGVTGGSLLAWLERRGAGIKLATAALFILLGAALVFSGGIDMYLCHIWQSGY